MHVIIEVIVIMFLLKTFLYFMASLLPLFSIGVVFVFIVKNYFSINVISNCNMTD